MNTPVHVRRRGIRGRRDGHLVVSGGRLLEAFLVRVDNPTGLSKVELRPASPNALPMFYRSTGKPDPKVLSEFFSGMDYKDLESKKTPPPPPAPKP